LSPEQKDDIRVKTIDFILRAIELSAAGDFLAGNSPQFQASSQLFYNGKVDLFPAEDATANANAGAQLKEAIDAEERMRALVAEAKDNFEHTPEGKEMKSIIDEVSTDTNLTDEEISTYVTRMDQLDSIKKNFIETHTTATAEFERLTAIVANSERIIHDVRETVVYEKVETFLNEYPNYAGSGMKCAVVEYGHNHTFAESAEAWNARPDVKISFGVIEIRDPTLKKSGNK